MASIHKSLQQQILSNLLPVTSIIITLRFIQNTQLKVLHPPMLRSLLWHLMGDDYATRDFLIPYCPESGRDRYQKGELYRFQLFCFANNLDAFSRLFSAIRQLPFSSSIDGPNIAFGKNIQFESAIDGFNGKMINDVNDCYCWQEQDLKNEVRQWKKSKIISFKWLAPVALSLPNKANNNKKSMVRSYDDIDARLLFHRIQDAYIERLKRLFPEQRFVAIKPPKAEMLSGHLFYVSQTYSNEEKSKLMAGILGELTVSLSDEISDYWLQLLVLGQYLGIGKMRNSGWGRYQLVGADNFISFNPASRATTILEWVASEKNVSTAIRDVEDQAREINKANSSSEETFDEAFNDIEGQSAHQLKVEIAACLADISKNTYRTPLLRGYLIKKSDGFFAPLTVPPLQDRILQQAVSQTISSVLEKIMHQSGCSYKKRLSKREAIDDVHLAIREGYNWVFGSYITDIFDCVDLSVLRIRLEALFQSDQVTIQILKWTSVDVEFEGQVIKRCNGLPNGSPLSPILANFILDNLNRELTSIGCRLVRFVDGFIILCKSPDHIKKTQPQPSKLLFHQLLTIEGEKTKNSNSDSGLGNLFTNKFVLDLDREKGQKNSPSISINRWLANLGANKVHLLNSNISEADLREVLSPDKQINFETGDSDNFGTMICVTGEPSSISTKSGRLQIRRDNVLVLDKAWNGLKAIVLFGHHQVTTQAMHEIFSNGISIHYSDNMGNHLGCSWNLASQGHDRWLRQQETFSDQEKCLAAAKILIKVKISKSAEVLRARKLDGIKELKRLAIELEKADNLVQLNGYEGIAAKCYFSSIVKHLPPDFNFKGRNRRPPKDPFNVMLSLGYTLLYGYTSSLLYAQGLLPTIGFYHQPAGKHHCLSSDLMEPFRFRVERKALAMVANKQIKSSDFDQSNTKCKMHSKAIRYYLKALVKDFEGSSNNQKPRRLTDQLAAQNRRLKRWIDHDEFFTANKTD